MSVHVKIVRQLYEHVIADVIKNVGEFFTEDGIEHTVLDDLRDAWVRKVKANKVTKPVKEVGPSGYSDPSVELQVSVQIGFKTDSEPYLFDLMVPASALKDNSYSEKLSEALGNEKVSRVLQMKISMEEKRALLQNIVNKCWSENIVQLDGQHSNDSDSDNDEDDDDSDDEDEDNEESEDEEDVKKDKEEVLGEEYALSDDDNLPDDEFFETDNIIACQYESIRKEKNQWKLHLKKGVMNINGCDFVFDQMIGDAAW